MTNKVKLTVARIAAFSCPDDKKQAFLWDADTPHLGVKIRPRGTPAFIYQGSLFRKPIQLVIGSALTWKIPEAQAEARRMQVLVDKKIHPQDERDASVAAAAQVLAEKEKTAVTVGEVWDIYVPRGVGKKGKPWSETYKKSLASAMHAGGEKFYRCGDRRTVTGPLFHLRDIPLNELDDDLLADIIGDELERIGERARQEKTENPAGYVTVKLAVEWLSGMFRWAGKQKEYKLLVQGNPARSETVQDGIPYQAGVQRMDFVEVPQLRGVSEFLCARHFEPSRIT